MAASLIHSKNLGLDWLPNETLFSLCSRIHRLSCHTYAAQTAKALFGSARVGCAHDLPGGLDLLTKRTHGELGSAHEIARWKTVLNYYLPLRGARDANNALASMKASHPGSLKFSLGLLTSRFRAHHPLKGCAQCMEEDVARHHVAYWHLEHQYPSAWVCPIHACTLLESRVKANGVRRFDWILPDEADLVPVAGHTHVDTTALLRLARDSLSLAQLPAGFHFDLDRVIRTYRARVTDLGFCSPGGRLRWGALEESYLAAVTPLRQVMALWGLPANETQAHSELGRLLRSTERPQAHPIRHLAIVGWLFHDWSEFMDAYRGLTDARLAAARPPPPISNAPKNPKRSTVVSLMRAGLSARRAAMAAAVDTTTAMAWAAAEGLEVQRRGKKLNGLIRAELVCALRRGAAKQSAAKRFNVSVQTVTTTLRTEAGLYSAWLEARRSLEQSRRRGQWFKLMRAHPDAGVKQLRTIDPACYAWLYRNDRSWLEGIVQSMPCKVSGNHASVRWDERDAALAHQIECAAEALAATTGRTSVARSELIQELPDLRPKLSKLDRMPLTARAIARATKRRPS